MERDLDYDNIEVVEGAYADVDWNSIKAKMERPMKIWIKNAVSSIFGKIGAKFKRKDN